MFGKYNLTVAKPVEGLQRFNKAALTAAKLVEGL